jgi:hypothetical protein
MQQKDALVSKDICTSQKTYNKYKQRSASLWFDQASNACLLHVKVSEREMVSTFSIIDFDV